MADVVEPHEVSCQFEIERALYAKAVEASPDAKIIIDRAGRIVIANQQAEYLFEYARSEMIGQPIEMLMESTLAASHAQHRETFFQAPRIREMGEGRMLEGRKRDGQPFRVQIKLAPLVVAQGGLYVMAVVRAVASPMSGVT